jgi:sulfotransferase family protein
MRSGTTSVTRYLRPHPEVFMSARKELHFFDFNFDRGIDWYRANFSRAADERAVGEATPNYLFDEEAIPRIRALLPGARLVAILRNPVDRAYSHYWHNRATGVETLEFGDALAAEPDRIAEADPQARARWSYVERGRYLPQLRRACEHFPRSSLHVSLFDDLLEAPTDTYRSICRFLEVNDKVLPPEPGEAANRFVTFRSRALRRLTRRLPKRARTVIGSLNTRGDGSYPPMDRSIRSMLVETFRAENSELGMWLDRDLSGWNA